LCSDSFVSTAAAKNSRTQFNVTKSQQALKSVAAWPPADVDSVPPPIGEERACALPAVLAGAGKRIVQMVKNVDRFTATELVQHQSVDRSGKLKNAEVKKFRYLVSLKKGPNQYLDVQEYRDGSSDPESFPQQIATTGTPAIVLIFHPKYAEDFDMHCEGLGEWGGQPAWLVRFEQRANRVNHMSGMVVGGKGYDLRIRGRAWILADSYEVARIESDLADTIAEIGLRLQHEVVEYHLVRFADDRADLWLPSSTELYMDFHGHRFYRRHTFTDFKLFSVGVTQDFGLIHQSNDARQGVPGSAALR
jgi:hypothetical protein